MIDIVAHPKSKAFLALLVMALTSCTISGSSSYSSDGSGSSLSEDSSETISTSSSISIELPSFGETATGSSNDWPRAIIETIFTSEARFDIPAFASSSPYFYEYMVGPEPAIAISTSAGSPDPEAIYGAQLEAASWTVHPEYQIVALFIVAIDISEEMIVSFVAYDEDFMIVIADYDPAMFEDNNVQRSDGWPQSVIDEYFGFETASIIPALASENPYFFVLPSSEDEALVIFTEASETAMTAYGGQLMQLGWSSYEMDGNVVYTDPSESIALVIDYLNGFITLFLINNEPEIYESATWPTSSVNGFVAPTALEIAIPSFAAAHYFYSYDEDEFGPYMTVTSESDGTWMGGYIDNLLNLGWRVFDIDDEIDDGYYAIDPAHQIILVLIETSAHFILEIHYYTGAMEGYLDVGFGSWQETEIWPEAYIGQLLGDNTALPMPAFASLMYQYCFQFDDYGNLLALNAMAEAGDDLDYAGVLESAGYTVIEKDIEGTWSYVAYDAEKLVMVYFYYADGWLCLVIREYVDELVTSDPEWPYEVMMDLFNGYLIPAFEFDGETLDYDVDEIAQAIRITIGNCGPDAFEAYIATLDQNYFRVYVNYENMRALATNAGGNIDVYIGFADGVLTLDVKSIDYVAYEAYFSTYIQITSAVFPNPLINQLLGEDMPNLLLPYVSESPFTYYAGWYVGRPSVHVEVASSLTEFDNYYAALEGDGWDMTYEDRPGERYFEATQAGYDGYVEATLNESTGEAVILISRWTMM